jgi:chromosomal replication initiation ATPase DnaA
MPEQLVFDLPNRPAQDAEDFLVSASNQAAVDLVDSWPDWPNAAMVVVGPAGVGKSHLVNVWKSRSGGRDIAAGDLTEEVAGGAADMPAVAIEDIDRGIASEKALFYLLNMAREHKHAVLLTSRVPPGELEVALPDLRSRLRALPVVPIAPTDDALLQGLLVKLFHDRQLLVEPATVRYILTHMERSAEAAVQVVSEMDHLALTTHRRVTRALAREVIYKLFSIKY